MQGLKKGTSLVEAVLALALFSIAIISLTALDIKTQQLMQPGKRELNFHFLIQQTLQEIKSVQTLKSDYLPSFESPTTFPLSDSCVGLAYSEEQQLIGSFSKQEQQQGVHLIGNTKPFYLVSFQMTPLAATEKRASITQLEILIEYPADVMPNARHQSSWVTYIK